jgi:hypothetical protein
MPPLSFFYVCLCLDSPWCTSESELGKSAKGVRVGQESREQRMIEGVGRVESLVLEKGATFKPRQVGLVSGQGSISCIPQVKPRLAGQADICSAQEKRQASHPVAPSSHLKVTTFYR